MINLNKLIVAGLFILIIIFLFHTHIKESFVQENDGMNEILSNEYSSLQRKRNNGSSHLTKQLLHTVSSHLQNMHIEKTIDLIKKTSYVSDGDDGKGQVSFSSSNDKQKKAKEEINHLRDLNDAVQQSIKYHDSMPTQKNILKAMFGNN